MQCNDLYKVSFQEYRINYSMVRFYWAWQLAAIPQIVLEHAISLDIEACWDWEHNPHECYLKLVLSVLSLMGYRSKEGPTDYEHFLLPERNVTVSVLEIRKHYNLIQFFSTVGCDCSVSTMLSCEIETNSPITKTIIFKVILGILKTVAQRLPMPRPRNGCLMILGEDFESTTMKAYFQYDMHLLHAFKVNPKQPMYIDYALNALSQSFDDIYTFSIQNDNNPIPMEYIVIKNQTKTRVLEIITLFFSMGYLAPVCLYYGHGTEGFGEWVVRTDPMKPSIKCKSHLKASKLMTSSTRDYYETITYKELCDAVEVDHTETQHMPPPEGLGNTLVLLHSPYAHVFASSNGSTASIHSPQSSLKSTSSPSSYKHSLSVDRHRTHHQILSFTTSIDCPYPTRTGSLLEYIRKHQQLLPIAYHTTLLSPLQRYSTLPSISQYRIEFIRSIYPILPTKTATIHTTKSLGPGKRELKSGIYVFSNKLNRSSSTIYIIYDSVAKYALIVDSGIDARYFYENVWLGFILPYVHRYDVILTKPWNSSTTTGLLAFTASTNFQIYQRKGGLTAGPYCGKLYIPYEVARSSTTFENFGRYEDLNMIIQLMQKAGVEIVRSVAPGTCVFSSKQRTLFAEHEITVEVIQRTNKNNHDVTKSYKLGSNKNDNIIIPSNETSTLEQQSTLTLSPREITLSPTIENTTGIHRRYLSKQSKPIILFIRGWTKHLHQSVPKIQEYILEGSAARCFSTTGSSSTGAGSKNIRRNIINSSRSIKDNNHTDVDVWDHILPFPTDY